MSTAITSIGKKARHDLKKFYYNHVRWPLEVRDRKNIYAQAKEIYKKDGGICANENMSPESMRVEVVVPGKADGFLTLPDNYLELVNQVAREADEQLKYTKNLSFYRNTVKIEGELPELVEDLPAYKNNELVKWALKDVSSIPTAEKISAVLAPLVEQHIYCSYVEVDTPYMYCLRSSHVGPNSSLLWHTDNHHTDSIKVMIYLHEVDENRGAFEYLVDAEGVPVYVPVCRPEIYPGGRITEEQIKEFEAQGYRRVKAVGPTGTTLFFSENMIHRGTIPREGMRKVLLLQFKPSLKKQTSFIN